MRTLLAVLSAAAAASASAAPPACCFYGGEGAATLMGLGTFSFPAAPGSPEGTDFLPIAVGATGESTADPFVAVLINPKTGPEDALAGWMIAPNASTGGQTLTAWTNFGGVPPTCMRGYAPKDEPFVPGYSMCVGMPGGLFPFANATYSLVGAGTVVNFDQSGLDVRARISVLGAGPGGACSPLFLGSVNNPLNSGAFSVSFEAGAPDAPSWGLPSWC
jgi:hypothetical protein